MSQFAWSQNANLFKLILPAAAAAVHVQMHCNKESKAISYSEINFDHLPFTYNIIRICAMIIGE